MVGDRAGWALQGQATARRQWLVWWRSRGWRLRPMRGQAGRLDQPEAGPRSSGRGPRLAPCPGGNITRNITSHQTPISPLWLSQLPGILEAGFQVRPCCFLQNKMKIREESKSLLRERTVISFFIHISDCSINKKNLRKNIYTYNQHNTVSNTIPRETI